MFPILFKIGPLTIYTYGFFVFLGVLCGYFACSSQAKKEGIAKDEFSDIFFWVIVFSFLGAKLLYLLIEWRYFLKNPLALIRSGFIFYGGIIAGLATVYFLAKRYKIKFLKLIDSIVIGIPLAHALGRLGCFFYGCCYGKPTKLWCGISFPKESPAGLSGLKVIPIQLVSVVSLVIIFLILLRIAKKKRFSGEIFLSYGFIYGIFRFVVEFFRGDPRGEIIFLSTSQLISLLVISLSGFLFYRWRRNY
ncbi:MAG: prolipoprotein diacylglyceryl transferase [Candidatus Omnitrophica bacterium]|nr:prolipoprotein diacylglyceryl transferase [Candidatus Omnitrophota bacterium]